MSEVTISKIPARRFRAVFSCVECGVPTERTCAQHKRCAACSEEHKNTYREKDFKRRFPVYYKPLKWFVEYLNDVNSSSDEINYRRELDKQRKRDRRREKGLMKSLFGALSV